MIAKRTSRGRVTASRVGAGQDEPLRTRVVAGRNVSVAPSRPDYQSAGWAMCKMILAEQYNYLAGELDQFGDLLHFFGGFEKPERNYNAFTLTARKRFSKNWLAQGSYTYARTIGNYNGLYDPQINQKDPNVTELYDLPDVLANRNGALPGDMPHQFKLDGYYTFNLNADNGIVLGTSFRAQSGVPRY